MRAPGSLPASMVYYVGFDEPGASNFAGSTRSRCRAHDLSGPNEVVQHLMGLLPNRINDNTRLRPYPEFEAILCDCPPWSGMPRGGVALFRGCYWRHRNLCERKSY